MENERDKITPEIAMQILGRKGLNVTREQAVAVLSFLYLIADIAVTKYLKLPP
jgi:hypothetical protein